MRRFGMILFAITAAAVLLVASGLIDVEIHLNGAEAFGRSKDADSSRSDEAVAFWQEGEQKPLAVPPQGAPASFADLAESVKPAVVSIRTETTVPGGHPRIPRQLEEFFGSPFGEPGVPGMPPDRDRRGDRKRKLPSGAGSGFVISEDGYIVTNNHVVENVDTIKVAFIDGSELEAEVVGRDPKTDVALIRVQSDDKLPALPLGDSDAIRPGDWVIAVGNPYGLSHTVTAGIVSAKHRKQIIGESYDDFIQTDAAINPGNSGGPLVNLRGEVVGINTAIRPWANTIGFTVPINLAKKILPQLRAHGRVTRGWLGVVIQDVTPELAEEFDLEQETGALVSRVFPGSPAAEAGLERGDVIMEFNGEPISSWQELPQVVADTPVGETVLVRIVREGKRKKIDVKIGEMDKPELAAADTEAESPESFGLRAQNLTPELAERLGVEEVKGVVITDIEPGNSADEAGLRRGDVIIEVDKAEVQDTATLKELLEKADDRVLVAVRRGKSSLYIVLKRQS